MARAPKFDLADVLGIKVSRKERREFGRLARSAKKARGGKKRKGTGGGS